MLGESRDCRHFIMASKQRNRSSSTRGDVIMATGSDLRVLSLSSQAQERSMLQICYKSALKCANTMWRVFPRFTKRIETGATWTNLKSCDNTGFTYYTLRELRATALRHISYVSEYKLYKNAFRLNIQSKLVTIIKRTENSAPRVQFPRGVKHDLLWLSYLKTHEACYRKKNKLQITT